MAEFRLNFRLRLSLLDCFINNVYNRNFMVHLFYLGFTLRHYCRQFVWTICFIKVMIMKRFRFSLQRSCPSRRLNYIWILSFSFTTFYEYFFFWNNIYLQNALWHLRVIFESETWLWVKVVFENKRCHIYCFSLMLTCSL